MDELQLVRDFRRDVPGDGTEARAAARQALLARIEAAGERPTRRWRVGRRRLIVAVALITAAGLAAASAFGLADRLVDFVRGEPAPPEVREQFARSFADRRAIVPFMDRQIGVIAEKTHAVLLFRTAVAPIVLWAAPTRRGTVCWQFNFADPKTGSPAIPPELGGCGPVLFLRRFGVVAVTQYATYQRTPFERASERAAWFVWGRTERGAHRVEVHLSGGTTKRLPVYERFFAGAIPSQAILDEVVAFDRTGRIVGSFRPGDIPGPPAGAPRRIPLPVGRYRPVIRIRRQGSTVTLAATRADEGGGYCTQLTTENNVVVEGCSLDGPRLLDTLRFGEHVNPSFAYLEGWVPAKVKSLELLYEDEKTSAVPLVGRFVLYVIPNAHERLGHRARLLLARDAEGRVLERQSLTGPKRR